MSIFQLHWKLIIPLQSQNKSLQFPILSFTYSHTKCNDTPTCLRKINSFPASISKPPIERHSLKKKISPIRINEKVEINRIKRESKWQNPTGRRATSQLEYQDIATLSPSRALNTNHSVDYTIRYARVHVRHKRANLCTYIGKYRAHN